MKPSKNLVKDKDKGEHSSHTHTRNIQCFKCLGRGHVASQCPNKKVMILKGKDIYKNHDEASSESEESSENEQFDRENSEDAYPCEGELLVIQRTLNN